MSPDDVILESIARARAVLDSGVSPKSLHWLLKRSDADLKARLLKIAGKNGSHTFTAAQAIAYREQIRIVTKYVEQRLGGLTHELASAAIAKGVKNTAATLSNLETAFTGVAKPLMVAQSARMSGMVEGVSSSLLSKHATSVDRYGKAMIVQHETLMARGMMTGVNQYEMIEALVGTGGPKGMVSLAAQVMANGAVVRLKEALIPEGLFMRNRYWAERIVRTETAHAYNAANLAAIHQARNLDFPDLGKKILATFDLRTAMDSVLVHGQVRPHDGLFQDGNGRQYQHPPARPNDRETVIPWRTHWPETALTKPVESKDAAELLAAPEIAQGKPVAVALADAKAQVAGQKALNTTQEKVTAAAKAAGERISAKAAKAVAEQKGTVGYLAAQAKAKAGLQAAKARIDQVQATELTQAQAKTQLAGTAAGKKAADLQAKIESTQAKVKAYKAELAASAKQLIEKKATDLHDQLQAIDKADHTAALALLKSAAKNDAPTLGHLYAKHMSGGVLSPGFMKTLAHAPLTKLEPLAKKLGFELPKKEPKAKPEPKMAEPAAWAKPYPKPVAFAADAVVLKEVPGGGFTFIDVHDPKGVKLAYVKKFETELVVEPPDPLKAKGWEKLTFPLGDTHTAAHYAVSVSKELQGMKAEIEADKALKSKAAQSAAAAKAQIEKAGALELARKRAEELWPKAWTGPKRPEVDLKRTVAQEIKAIPKGAPAWSVASDGGVIEDFDVRYSYEKRGGKTELVAAFKVRSAHSSAMLDSVAKLGAENMAAGVRVPQVFTFQGARGKEVKDNATRAQVGMLGETKITMLRGHEEAAAMHNHVEIRVPVGKHGEGADQIREAFRKLNLEQAMERPSAQDINQAAKARVAARMSSTAAETLARTGDVSLAWEQAKKADPATQAVLDDAKLVRFADGRIGLYSSKLADQYGNITHLTHHGSADEDIIAGVLEPGGGLLSSAERYSRGVFTTGMSTSTDFTTGGADSVFVRLSSEAPTPKSASMAAFHIDRSELGRLDAYSYGSDHYGKAHLYDSRMTPKAANERAVTGELSGSNETMLRRMVPPEAIRAVIVPASARPRILAELKKRGILQVGGVLVEDLVK